MRKYKFFFLFLIVVVVFMVLSWFIYDGIDIFFDLVYKPTEEKTEEIEKTEKAPVKERTEYTTDPEKEIIRKDHTVPPDTRYVTSKRVVQKESTFEKFLVRIFPEQLDYFLNPYTFFLILILAIIPVIGIFVYLIIYYLR